MVVAVCDTVLYMHLISEYTQLNGLRACACVNYYMSTITVKWQLFYDVAYIYDQT